MISRCSDRTYCHAIARRQRLLLLKLRDRDADWAQQCLYTHHYPASLPSLLNAACKSAISSPHSKEPACIIPML